MAAQKTEIIGTYLGPSQRWGDTVLGRIDYEDPSGQPARLTIKGRDANNNLKLHQRYRFYGRWTSYKHKPPKNFTERQFAFDSYVQSVPASRQGVIAYLKELPGIALGLAGKLWDAYGAEAVEVLRTQPERVAREIAGMSAAKACEAAAALGETSKAERANIDILGMLAGRGFPRTIAPRLLQKFGNRAAELVQKNPYLLMQFPGCGFKRADKMYLDLGHPPGRLKRQALCLAKAAGDDGDGHTWLPAGRICASLDGNIGGAEPQYARALYLAKRARKVDTLRDRNDRLWVADYTRAQQEQYIAQRVAEMLSEGPPEKWPEPDELKGVSDHQREKTAQALRGRLAILTGGPGTGKTHTLASIISAIEDFEYPTSFPGRRRPKIEICAPTGKAAVRMMSALAQAGHVFDGMTIHCLLNVKAVDGGGWSFHYNARNPLRCDILIVDEVSMLGVPLAASLFAAIPPECHVLLVGDIGQLPPVEHGAVLRDLIAAGVPCGELTEPRRNSGAIVECCTAIRRGTAPIVAPGIDLKAANPQNLVLGHATTPDEQKDRLLAAIDVARQLDMDPIWDFQVLVPLNDKSDVSRKRLNTLLQGLLNPQGLSVAGNPFRVGDKVINLKNGMYDAFRDKPADGAEQGDELSDAKHFVANGDMGKVAAVGAKWTRVQLQTPDRDIIVPHGEIKEESEGDGEGGSEEATKARWDLAYAVTVHKSQGSQWPVVAVMLDEHASAMRLTSREWIFTAISRAQKLCLLIGRKQKLEAMCRRQVLGTRKTFLAELLPEKITLQALAKM